MVDMGQAIRDDVKVLGHASMSVCQYVCLCVQSWTISKIPRCPIQIILRIMYTNSLSAMSQHLRICAATCTYSHLFLALSLQVVRYSPRSPSPPRRRRRRHLSLSGTMFAAPTVGGATNHLDRRERSLRAAAATRAASSAVAAMPRAQGGRVNQSNLSDLISDCHCM